MKDTTLLLTGPAGMTPTEISNTESLVKLALENGAGSGISGLVAGSTSIKRQGK